SNIPFPTIGKHSFSSSLNIFGINLPYQANYYYLVLAVVLFSLLLETVVLDNSGLKNLCPLL
ncbi:unnamed protein product, partial [marine sediment metagenome]